MIVGTLQVKPVTITSILLFTFLWNFVLVYCDQPEKGPEVGEIEKAVNIQLGLYEFIILQRHVHYTPNTNRILLILIFFSIKELSL